ncbi:hypothetical protein [Klebsiella aerogenes]
MYGINAVIRILKNSRESQ